ncbi:rhodanese-like domain-containing protein [Paenibacillus sp. MMS18-CY102]|uniref:rhodanese-like domain-containing protein n=1 Tax=Paenibacillus sp. MMS18-CY102 TaxID=2682849 RepID=UPI001365CB24|nr:rhodanese-like domain-containing protein [Paenibacillus sp. MMS18-CY102]MWC31204.1 rhodanese-like domain-containing protein [Paenibacillus sp. MMS18-CY102]
MYGEISTDELLQKLEAGEKLCLIDVREADEWQDGHIEQAIHLPLSALPARQGELTEGEEPFYIICRSGNRSGRACEYLATQGYEVINVTGGMLNWNGNAITGE